MPASDAATASPTDLEILSALDGAVPGEALPPAIEQTFAIPSLDVREKALPIRPGDLTRLLLAQPGLTPEEALSGAPAQEEQRFAVPRILGDEQ